VNKVESLDAKGLMCPMPIVKMAKKMKEMEVGKMLELISDDVGSVDDVPAWCKRNGNELVEMKQEGSVYYYYIRRAAA
jgi:tRNA 2-thiouridine synthesizing protein A